MAAIHVLVPSDETAAVLRKCGAAAAFLVEETLGSGGEARAARVSEEETEGSGGGLRAIVHSLFFFVVCAASLGSALLDACVRGVNASFERVSFERVPVT